MRKVVFYGATFIEVIMNFFKCNSILLLSLISFGCKPKPLSNSLKSNAQPTSKHLVFRADAFVDDSYQFTVELGPFPGGFLNNNQIELSGNLDLCQPGTELNDVAKIVLDEFAKVASKSFNIDQTRFKMLPP